MSPVETKVQAYMIMDFNNPVSVEYSERSLATFKPVEHLINISRVQCTIPDDLVYIAGTKDQYGAGPGIQVDDLMLFFPEYYKSKSRKYSESEKAGYVSHIKLWMRQAASPKRFIIMEHDAFLRDVSLFEKQLQYILNDKNKEQKDLYAYWNVGIAIECYSLHRKLAQYIQWTMTRTEDPWNHLGLGPMGLLYKHSSYWNTLYPADGFNNKLTNGEDAPVTQMYSPRLGITLDHTINNNKFHNLPNLQRID